MLINIALDKGKLKLLMLSHSATKPHTIDNKHKTCYNTILKRNECHKDNFV